jgi:hypothetical protein
MNPDFYPCLFCGTGKTGSVLVGMPATVSAGVLLVEKGSP